MDESGAASCDRSGLRLGFWSAILTAVCAASFPLIAAAVLTANYFIQLAVVQPSLLHKETVGLAPLLMYNPHGILLGLEDLGYLLMSVAFVFISLTVAGRDRLQRLARWLFLVGRPVPASRTDQDAPWNRPRAGGCRAVGGMADVPRFVPARRYDMSTTIDRQPDMAEARGERIATNDFGSMPSSQLYRIGGLAVVVGAVAFIAYIVARSALTAGVDPVSSAKNGLWVPINTLGFLGAALVLLGLPAIYVGAARRSGRLGLVGLILIALSWMFFGLFLSLYGALVQPWLADKAPLLLATSAPIPTGFVVAFVAGLATWLAGSVLFAIPFLRGRVQPRWVGYLLLLSGLWAIAGDLIVPSGPSSNLAINLLTNLGPVLLLIALGYLGFRLWSPLGLRSR